jgi:membrane protein
MHVPDALPRNLDEAVAFARALVQRFREDRCLQLAASLTYTTLLALVPLITVALAVVTAFPVFGEFTSRVDDWLAENVLPEQIAGAITSYIGQFAQKAGRLTALGIAGLALTAVMMMLTIDRGLNQIWRVTRPRPLVQRLLMYWAVLTLGPLLIGLSVSMTSYLVSESLGLAKGLPLVGEFILRVTPIVLTTIAITLLYLIVPNRRVRASHALLGGLLAAVLFELTKRGFALYVTKFPTYTLVYGAFAAIPMFLVWLYVSWLVVLAGAALTAMLPGYSRKERRGRPAGQHFYEALDVLGQLVAAQRNGHVTPLSRLAHALQLAPEQCERMLARMAALGWTTRTAGEGWVLTRDAGSLTVGDMFEAFVFDPRAAQARYEGVEKRLEVPLEQLFASTEEAPPERRRFELFIMRGLERFRAPRDLA